MRLCGEDKGTRRVKDCLHESNDRTLNYSKESRLLCVMLDAVPQQQCFHAVHRRSHTLPPPPAQLKQGSEWGTGPYK